jgi:Sulfotransferase domain
VLRDPVKRAVSALNHHIRSGWSSPFANPDEVLTQALDPDRDRYGLIDRGRYLTHIERFLELYPRDRLHIVFFEDDIVKAPDATIQRVMTFLGRDAMPVKPARLWPENQRMNSRLGLVLNYYAPRLSPLISAVDRLLPVQKAVGPSAACRARLYEHFAPYNRDLFAFLGCTPRWKSA